MRTTTKVITTAAATTTLAIGIALGAQAALGSPTSAPADTELASALIQMREEERMARDLYAALAELHDQARPMSVITKSEQKHFDSMGTLLERYDVADPSAALAPGTYALPEIQALYDSWYAQGSVSLDAAYQVGIELETRDIADLETAIALAPTDVERVLNNRRCRRRPRAAPRPAAREPTCVARSGSEIARCSMPFTDWLLM